jgi:sterol desaturase/sphingolipid hydroxylase (fatty acid hydroxylase superfamily)
LGLHCSGPLKIGRLTPQIFDSWNKFYLFFTENTKLLLIAGAVFVLLEFLRPARRQRKWRKDSSLDLIYSFVLPILVYPASILLSTWFIGQFWLTPANPADTGSLQQTVTQPPEHGQAEIQSDGKVIYHPNPGFLSLDRFTATTEYNQNIITRTFLVKVNPASGVSGENASPAIYIAEVDKQVSGKVTEGFSGFFFQIRQTIYGWNLGLQLLLATFLFDLAGYWRHRLMHTRFLWLFHAIHHGSKELDWLSNERFHPINTYISYLLSLMVLILFFEDPFVFAMCMPLRKAYGMFIHSNVKISYGPLDTIFASPLFHHWHHSASEMADRNYCTFFPFWIECSAPIIYPKTKRSRQRWD